VGRQLAHGRALAMRQHRGIQVVVLLVQLRAFAGAARGQLKEVGHSRISGLQEWVGVIYHFEVFGYEKYSGGGEFWRIFV